MRRISTAIVIVALIAAVFVTPLHARRTHRPDDARIEKLVNDLADEHIATRLEAQFELVRIGERARSALREAAAYEGHPYREMVLETAAAIDDPIGFFFDASVRTHEMDMFIKIDKDYQRALTELAPYAYLFSYGRQALQYALHKIDDGQFLDAERYYYGMIYAQFADATAERKLIGLLKRGDASQRSIALEMMSLRPSPRVIELLIENMRQTENSGLRIAVAEALMHVRDSRVIEAFTDLIYDEEIGTNAIMAVCADLGRTGKTNPAVTMELLQMLGDEDATERYKACSCLAMYRPLAPLDQLRELSDDYNLAVDIMRAVTRSQTASMLNYIRQFVDAPYPVLALTAVQCLLQLGEHLREPGFVPYAYNILERCARLPLEYGTRDYGYQIVCAAIDCLYQYFGPEAEDKLIMIVKEADPAAAAYAAYALRELRSTKALPLLRESLDKNFTDDHAGTLLALIVLQDKEAIPIIEKRVDSPWPKTRKWARLALFSMGRDEYRDEVLAMTHWGQLDFRAWAMHAFALRGEIDAIAEVIEDISAYHDRAADLEWVDKRLMQLTWHSVSMNPYAGTDVVRKSLQDWKKWLRANHGRDLEEIKLRSFNERGYKVVSFKTVTALRELVCALNDTEADMRLNAAEELARRLGKAFPGQYAVDAPEDFRALVVKQITKWIDDNADKLVWSAKDDRFIVNK